MHFDEDENCSTSNTTGSLVSSGSLNTSETESRERKDKGVLLQSAPLVVCFGSQ